MLQNEQTTEQQPTPTGQNRVTPDELNRALAIIEARKQAEAQRLAGTIPLEEAISQLHLDATSDEIWSEVEAQRNKHSAEEARTFAEADEARRARLGTAPTSQPPLQTRRFTQPNAHRGRPRVFTFVVAASVLFSTGIINHFRHHSHTAPVLRPLGQMPDGQEAYASDSALIQISEGKPAAQVTVSENAASNHWRLVKLGGHVYLRGYIASADSLQPLRGKALNVYNDDNAGELEGERTSNVTLRVDKTPLQKSGGDDGYSEITVPNFQPDPLTTLSPWR